MQVIHECFLVNQATASCQPVVSGIGKYYVMTVNMDAFKPGARKFDEYGNPDSARCIGNERLHQLFFVLAERLAAKCMASKLQSKKLAPSKRKRTEDECDGDEGMEELEAEEEEEEEDQGSLPSMEMCYEPLLAEFDTRDPPEDAQVLGYRLWVFLRGDKDSMDQELESLLEENAKLRVQRLTTSEKTVAPTKDHEKYRDIYNLELLGVMFDIHSNTNAYSSKIRSISASQTLASGLHPASASNIFGIVAASIATSQYVNEDQGMYKLDRYVQLDQGTNTYSVKFPLPKYVLRVCLSQITVQTLRSRLFPHIQHAMGMSRTAKMWPSLLLSTKKRSGQQMTPWEIDQMNAARAVDRHINTDNETSTRPDRFNSPAAKRRFAEKAMALAKNAGMAFIDANTKFDAFDPSSLIFFMKREMAPTEMEMMLASKESEYKKLAKRGHPLRSAIENESVEAKTIIQNIALDAISRVLDGRSESELSTQERAEIDRILEQKERREMQSEVRARIQTLALNMELMEQFNLRCRSPDANIGPCGKTMYAFAEEVGMFRGGYIVNRKMDVTMPTFANILFRRTLENGYLSHVAKTDVVNMLEIGSLDASRHAYSLHFNALLHSHKGATSKSFTFEHIERNRIPGTVLSLTFVTKRADAVDEDRNDYVTCWNEMPAAHVAEGYGTADESQAQTRDSLTRGVFSFRTFDISKNDSGVRKARVGSCENMGSMLGATNAPTNTLSPASTSRFYCINTSNDTGTKHISIQEMKVSENYTGVMDRVAQEQTQKQRQAEQMLMFEVDKLIQTGALMAPSQEVASVLMLMLENEASTRGFPPDTSRKFEKDMILANVFCKLDAVVQVFGHPSGAGYGKSIDATKYADIDRKLVVTTEHVVAAFGMSFGTIVTSGEEHVAKLIIKKFNELQTYGRKTNPIKTVRMDQSDMDYLDKIESEVGCEKPKFGDNRNGYNSSFKDSTDTLPDYNYVSIPLPKNKKNTDRELKALSESLAKSVLNAGSEESIDSAVVEAVIRSWDGKFIKSHEYRRKNEGYGRSEFDMLEEDRTTQSKVFNMCKITEDAIWFHVGTLKTERRTQSELYESILKKVLGHRFMSSKRLAIGMSRDDDRNIQTIVEVGHENPDDESLPILTLPNPTYMTQEVFDTIFGAGADLTSERKKEAFFYNVDLDTAAYMYRNRALHVTENRVDPSWIVPNEENRPGYMPLRGVANTEHTASACYFMGQKLENTAVFSEETTLCEKDLIAEIDAIPLELFDGTNADVDMGCLDRYMLQEDYYHWQDLPNMQPAEYKMASNHPKIVTELEASRDYGNVRTYRYPEDYLCSKKDRANRIEKISSKLKQPGGYESMMKHSPHLFIAGAGIRGVSGQRQSITINYDRILSQRISNIQPRKLVQNQQRNDILRRWTMGAPPPSEEEDLVEEEELAPKKPRIEEIVEKEREEDESGEEESEEEESEEEESEEEESEEEESEEEESEDDSSSSDDSYDE
jgi:hypothetical protein